MKHETHALPAVNGYDVVSYFSGSPMKGTGTLASEHMGQTYLFSSEENKEMFDGNPEKYVPQFGGWCAYGVSVNKKFHIDPSIYEIVDGKLYFNLNDEICAAFKEDMPGAISKAEANWKEIQDKSPSEL